jgi:hypothetical protein
VGRPLAESRGGWAGPSAKVEQRRRDGAFMALEQGPLGGREERAPLAAVTHSGKVSREEGVPPGSR